MRVRDIFNQLKGRQIRIGGDVGYIYCGRADEYGAEYLKFLSRSVSDTSSRKLKAFKEQIKNLESDIKSASDEERPMLEDKLQSILSSRDYKIAKYFRAIMGRNVVDSYDSITDDAKIFIIDTPLIGKYWDKEEFANKNLLYKTFKLKQKRTV